MAELEFPEIIDKIKHCIDVILKEAKLEDRLVKQIFYTMLSAYTNNPQNLGINSPSGEGKNYVLRRVAENFPKEDVMFFAGMTDKALFHRTGKLVVKNDVGGYESIEEMIKECDSRIEGLESEMSTTNDRITKQGLKAQIKSIEEEKKDLYKNAKKLIDLSHKILIFLDTPRFELFSALMSLLSHDNYEVEYEYADTTNTGIKTRANVIRGYPAVIFAQALDFSHYKRYPEIQRRFIITNPKMDKQKYKEAIKLIGKKFGLSDFMYQMQVVSNQEKEQVREIIRGLKEKILNVCDAIDPGRNNVIIPFEEVIVESLQSNKAQDMTVAYRLFSYLSLLPIVNIDKRPRIVFRKKGEPITQVIPLVTYEDLAEAMFLMQYANGVRPYILEWYYSVFLKTYNAKTKPDSKLFDSGEKLEDRIAVTTEDLVIATREIQNKSFTNKKILESYLEPLMNEGYIDKRESSINHRSNIYYPTVLVDDSSEKSLFDGFLGQKSNNEQQISRIKVSHFTLNPTSEYIKTKVEQMLCCSSTPDLVCELFDDNKNKITVDELVSIYYKNPSTCFCFKDEQQSIVDKGVDTDTKNNDFSKIHVVDEQGKEQEISSVGQTEVSVIRLAEKSNNEYQPSISIYRIGHSDIFACENCKIKGDRFFMETHICGKSKKQNHKDNFNIFNLIKCKYVDQTDGNNNKYSVILAGPAKGVLYVTEGSQDYISGQVRMRGRDGGRYPYNYLEMIDHIFGSENNTIEICSGSIKGRNASSSPYAPYTIDINPSLKPDYVTDAQKLDGVSSRIFNRLRGDPPYNDKTARKMYGTELPNPLRLLEAGARVCKPGSLMFLLLGNSYQHHPKGVKRIGCIAMSVIPSNEVRFLNIYLKYEDA